MIQNTMMKKFILSALALLSLNIINAQISFPDSNFKSLLLSANNTNQIAFGAAGNPIKVDSNNDGEIQSSEALNIFKLNVAAAGISDISGIQNFTNLRDFDCSNNSIDNLPISNLINLNYLKCNSNELTAITIENLTALKTIDCSYNFLTILDTSTLNELSNINCSNNAITTLTLSPTLPSDYFEMLDCSYNNISSLTLYNSVYLLDCQHNVLSIINFEGVNSIGELYCNNNFLANLDLGETEVFNLFASDNQLTSIDLSSQSYMNTVDLSSNLLSVVDTQSCHELRYLFCDFNDPLTAIIAKNGSMEYLISFTGTPNITSICVDYFQVEQFTNLVALYGYTNCEVNPAGYCDLGIADNVIENSVSIYPNPANEILNIKSVSNLQIKSVSIYNTLGQSVLEILDSRNFQTLDVSKLSSGTYIIKLHCHNGVGTNKFLKN